MLNVFEVKSYSQLQFRIGIVNTIFVFILIIILQMSVLTDSHTQMFDDFVSRTKANKLLGQVLTVTIISIVWGWLSTIVLRIHDRIHEPYIRKWRAGYDADFILRGVSYEFNQNISPDIFEIAYVDKRICKKMMQNMFYKYCGDYISKGEGQRVFFYTTMWKYWSFALCDFYSMLGLLFYAAYHIWQKTRFNPYLVTFLTISILLSRFIMNKLLDEAHSITASQIYQIRTENRGSLEEGVKNLGEELNFWRDSK